MEKICKTAEDIKALAAQVAGQASAGDVFVLIGNLGAGKTTFAQGFIESLLKKKEAVTSPTFNIIQLYETTKGRVYHCDLYRVKNIDEVINLGIEDIFANSITLIEWPEIAQSLLPDNTRTIFIESLPGGHRKVIVK